MPTSPPRGRKLVVPCAWSPGSMMVSGGRGSAPLAPRRGAGCPSLMPASPSLQAEAAVAAVAVADTVRDGPPSVGSDGASKTWGLVSPAPGAPPGGSTGPSAAASFFLRYVLLGAWPGGVLTGPRARGLAACGPLRGGLWPACCPAEQRGVSGASWVTVATVRPEASPSWVFLGGSCLVSGPSVPRFPRLSSGASWEASRADGGRTSAAAGGHPQAVLGRFRREGAGGVDGRQGQAGLRAAGPAARGTGRNGPEGASLGHRGGWRELRRVSWGLLLPGGPRHIVSLVVPSRAQPPLPGVGGPGYDGGDESCWSAPQVTVPSAPAGVISSSLCRRSLCLISAARGCGTWWGEVGGRGMTGALGRWAHVPAHSPRWVPGAGLVLLPWRGWGLPSRPRSPVEVTEGQSGFLGGGPRPGGLCPGLWGSGHVPPGHACWRIARLRAPGEEDPP